MLVLWVDTLFFSLHPSLCHLPYPSFCCLHYEDGWQNLSYRVTSVLGEYLKRQNFFKIARLLKQVCISVLALLPLCCGALWRLWHGAQSLSLSYSLFPCSWPTGIASRLNNGSRVKILGEHRIIVFTYMYILCIDGLLNEIVCHRDLAWECELVPSHSQNW